MLVDYGEKQLGGGVCINDTLNFVCIFSFFIFLYSQTVFTFFMTLMYTYIYNTEQISAALLHAEKVKQLFCTNVCSLMIEQ
jgi:hypothetical protein